MNIKNLPKLLLVVVSLLLCSCTLVEDINTLREPTITPSPPPPTPTPEPTPVPTPSISEFASHLPDVELADERPIHITMADPEQTAQYVYRSTYQQPGCLATGPDGSIYICDNIGYRIFKRTPDGKTFELGLWKRIEALRKDGPKCIAVDSEGKLYVSNTTQIFCLNTDGFIYELNDIDASLIGGLAVSPKDELYFTDQGGGKLLKWTGDEGVQIVMEDLPDAHSIAFSPDGAVLYLTQYGHYDLMAVDTATGEARVFIEKVCLRHPCYLTVHEQGNLWMTGPDILRQFSPEGPGEPIIINGQPLNKKPYDTNAVPGGLAFDDNNNLWLTWAGARIDCLEKNNPESENKEFTEKNVFSPNDIFDIAAGSDDVVYIAFSDDNVLQKTTFDNKLKPILKHNYTIGDYVVAVDGEDTLYLGFSDGVIIMIANANIEREFARLLTRSIIHGHDGKMYAIKGGEGDKKALLRVSDIEKTVTVAKSIDEVSLGKGRVTVSASPEGLYVYVEDEQKLLYLDYDGQNQTSFDLPELLSDILFVTSSTTTGHIYVLDPESGIIYKISKEGSFEEYAYGFKGGSAMTISRDGKYLYAVINGSIIRISL